MVTPDVEHELSERTSQLLEAPLPEEPKARRVELERRSAVRARMVELATQATTAGEFLLALADESLLPPGDEVYEDIQPLPPLPGETEGEDARASDETVRQAQEASKVWQRPEVQRMLERMAQGLPPVDEEDEW
jgi:hypothetical protein